MGRVRSIDGSPVSHHKKGNDINDQDVAASLTPAGPDMLRLEGPTPADIGIRWVVVLRAGNDQPPALALARFRAHAGGLAALRPSGLAALRPSLATRRLDALVLGAVGHGVASVHRLSFVVLGDADG